MLRLTAIILSLSVILILGEYAGAETNSHIIISSKTINQGDLSLITVMARKGEIPEVTWMNKVIPLRLSHDQTRWQGFIGADLEENPGIFSLNVKRSQSHDTESYETEIVQKEYGVRRLTLPKKMVDLDAKTLQRVQKETVKINKIWEAPGSNPAWDGPIIRPLPGEVVGPFGRRSIINDQPRSPHTGVDLRGEKGVPVLAINGGRVVLTGDHFFTGNTVFIDHGGKIISMYFHLDNILVKDGDIVPKGHVIGHVGSTGRVTGPHLHFAIRVNGSRIDPLRLIQISQESEE